MKPLAIVPSRMPTSGIREIMDLAAQMPDAINLGVGEPDFNTPDIIIEGAMSAARSGFTKYTPTAGYLSLREAIVKRLEAEHGLTEAPDHVIVTAGAVGALAMGILATVDPGDEVLIPDPGWPNYTSIVMVAGAKPVPYALDRESGYLPDIAVLDRLVTKRTKLIITNNPGNPTGAVFCDAAVRALTKFGDRHDLYVLSDEVYDSFVFEGEHVPAARFDHDGRVITVQGVSKTYAMTGWRIGYAIAQPPITALMTKLQQSLLSCPSSVSQQAAQVALEMDVSTVRAMRDSYRERRNLAVSILGSHLAAIPGGAFYALVDLSSVGSDSYQMAKDLLLRQGVATAPGETFGASGGGLVRISLAAEPTLLAEGCRRILRYLGE